MKGNFRGPGNGPVRTQRCNGKGSDTVLGCWGGGQRAHIHRERGRKGTKKGVNRIPPSTVSGWGVSRSDKKQNGAFGERKGNKRKRFLLQWGRVGALVVPATLDGTGVKQSGLGNTQRNGNAKTGVFCDMPTRTLGGGGEEDRHRRKKTVKGTDTNTKTNKMR